MTTIEINDTLHAELTPDGRHIRIVREGASLVTLGLPDVRHLVAALTELAARAAAEAAGQEYVSPDDLLF